MGNERLYSTVSAPSRACGLVGLALFARVTYFSTLSFFNCMLAYAAGDQPRGAGRLDVIAGLLENVRRNVRSLQLSRLAAPDALYYRLILVILVETVLLRDHVQ